MSAADAMKSAQKCDELSCYHHTLNETKRQIKLQIKHVSSATLKKMMEKDLSARDLLEWKINLAVFFQFHQPGAVVTVTDVKYRPESFVASIEIGRS